MRRPRSHWLPLLLFACALLAACGLEEAPQTTADPRLETGTRTAEEATPGTPQSAGEGRRVIATENAPEAIGPYSQAVQVGATLYLAGQLGMDPGTGELVEGGIEAETRQALENLGAVLEAAGFGFGDVVQSQVFLTELDEFGAMNEVYASFFGEAPPARATVEVSRLPRDARVEIQLVASR